PPAPRCCDANPESALPTVANASASWYRKLKALTSFVKRFHFGARTNIDAAAQGGIAVNDRARRRTPVAQAISLILGTSILTPAFAQNTELEEVIVTGIRGSLTSSMELKRDSQGVVDGIVAEDIGKFPDTNLAESLQRISGVSIDRSIGEGSRVTV